MTAAHNVCFGRSHEDGFAPVWGLTHEPHKPDPSAFAADTMTGNTYRHTVTIKNPQGFHMRPIEAFVAVASKFPGTVAVMRVGSPSVNGKSMLHLMGLAAEQGHELLIEVCGDGARDILPKLVEIFERNYDEE